MLPCKMQALKPSTRFVGRPGQEGEPLAEMAYSPPSCWVTFPSSSHSHSVITVISKIHRKSPGTSLNFLSGTPESQGPSPLQIGTSFGLPQRGCTSQNFVIYSGPRTGCTSLVPTANEECVAGTADGRHCLAKYISQLLGLFPPL